MPNDEIKTDGLPIHTNSGETPSANAVIPQTDSAPSLKSSEPSPPQPTNAEHHLRRRILLGAVGILLLSAVLYYGIPWVYLTLNTISTDDAYVNGYVTFVAARVPGQVVKVLVDNNNRVRKGDVLAQLDKKPYQVQLELQKAVVENAKANLVVAQEEARAMVAQARANRYKLQHAIEDVDNQIAVLAAKVAALETAKAQRARANADYQRALELAKTPGAISQQDIDLRKEAYSVAEAQIQQALQQVYQIRASLGLPEEPNRGKSLSDVPKDLDQNSSTVREALGQLLASAAPLGIVPQSYTATPNEVIAEFYRRDPKGNLDRILAKILEQAPSVKLAQSKLDEAQAQLDQAELNLSYCDVISEIDGVITSRDVNPGNNVQSGQQLMAIRSLSDIWIDGNFKETQLAELRIGDRVDVHVDMYGKRHVFKGRISGFTMGTGSTLALLPPENATGNFVKVVQRLPVRIDLIDYNPDKAPLFFGLSVVPFVYFKEAPTGPNAGQVLQPYIRTKSHSPSASSTEVE